MSDQKSDQQANGGTDPLIGLGQAARRDPFAHDSLPMRPTFLPEEGEGGRSELWHTLKALAIAVVAIGAIGWLLTALR